MLSPCLRLCSQQLCPEYEYVTVGTEKGLSVVGQGTCHLHHLYMTLNIPYLDQVFNRSSSPRASQSRPKSVLRPPKPLVNPRAIIRPSLPTCSPSRPRDQPPTSRTHHAACCFCSYLYLLAVLPSRPLCPPRPPVDKQPAFVRPNRM